MVSKTANMQGLSLLVFTSPGRERNLKACLQALSRQSLQADEILVFDDGSEGGAELVKDVQQQLPVRCLWRPNDGCLALSRNLGAAAARFESLVFLDSDMLLNPHALGYYRAYLEQLRDCAIYGYHGNIDESVDYYPSAILPELDFEIHAEDQRFPWVPGQGISLHPHLEQRPAAFAWGGNFGISKSLYLRAGGSNQKLFKAWGYEDIDLANRLQNLGAALHFSLDVWSEACPHAHRWLNADKDQNQKFLTPLNAPHQPVRILHDSEGSGLLRAWQQTYAPVRQRKGNVLLDLLE